MKLSRAAVAVAASALLTLTACGSSEQLASEGSRTSNSVEQRAADVTNTGSELTESNFLSTIVQAQLEAGSARVAIAGDVAGQPITMTGALETGENLEESAVQAEVDVSGLGSVEVVLVDAVIYLKLDGLTGGKYIELPLDGSVAEQFLGQLKSHVNPAEIATALEGAVTGFEVVGADTVDGEETTQYVLEVDSSKGLAQQGVRLPDGAELPKVMTYTFWIDDRALPLRITADMGEVVQLDVSLSDWGEPVDIQAPAGDQITEDNPFASVF